ncbi:MAG: hypothetical protein V1793_17445 [Pseudomonadota bacterium]
MLPLLVEGIEILRSSLNDLFHLTFWDMGTRIVRHEFNGSVKGPLCDFKGNAALQFEGVSIFGQIQRGVQR